MHHGVDEYFSGSRRGSQNTGEHRKVSFGIEKKSYQTIQLLGVDLRLAPRISSWRVNGLSSLCKSSEMARTTLVA